MRERIKISVSKLLAIGVVLAVVVGVVSVLAIFGGFIMTFFGFRYESMGSIILFFIIAAVISWPINGLAQVLASLLYHEFNRLSLFEARVLFVFLDTLATFIGMVIVDYLMKSVSANDSAILVVSFLFAITSIKDIE